MEEFKKETGLSRSNQETAIKQLVKLNLLEYRLAQVPRKRHFRLRLNILEQVLVGMLKDKHINYLNVTHTNANRANSSLPESSTLIHKTTHEITQETTSKTTGNAGILDKDSFKREKEKLMEKMGINELVPNDFDNKEQVNGQ
jgi:DNA-binding transcriptional regulator GbsR (MarR family)